MASLPDAWVEDARNLDNAERILLQRNSENLLCLPDNQLVDATISDSPSLSQADVQRFIDYAFWCQIWSVALMTSVVKSSAKFSPLDPDDFRSPVIRQLLLSSYSVSPFDALNRLINSAREFQEARRAHDFTTLMSYYRQIRRPVAVFIDTIDEYFEGYVDKGSQYDEGASYLHR